MITKRWLSIVSSIFIICLIYISLQNVQVSEIASSTVHNVVNIRPKDIQTKQEFNFNPNKKIITNTTIAHRNVNTKTPSIATFNTNKSKTFVKNVDSYQYNYSTMQTTNILTSKTQNLHILIKEYNILHSMILKGILPPRYIIYHPNAQMGNRIRGIVSAYLFAIITQRALLIDFSTGPYSNIKLTDLFILPDFDYEYNKGKNIEARNNGPGLKPITKFTLPISQTDDKIWNNNFNHLLCSNYDIIYNYNILTVEGNFYWSTYIEHNPFYTTFISTHFDQGRVGQTIHNILFRPHPDVIAMKNDWLRSNGLLLPTTNTHTTNNHKSSHSNNNSNISGSKYLISYQLRNDDVKNNPQV